MDAALPYPKVDAAQNGRAGAAPDDFEVEVFDGQDRGRAQFRITGSNAWRNPSPRQLRPRTETMMQPMGKVITHQA